MFFIVVLHLRMNDIRSYPRLKNDHLWHWMKITLFFPASSSSYLRWKRTHTKSQRKQINEKILSHLTMIIKSLLYTAYNHHVLLLFFVSQWNSMRCIMVHCSQVAMNNDIVPSVPPSPSMVIEFIHIDAIKCFFFSYYKIHLRCDLRSEPTFFPI